MKKIAAWLYKKPALLFLAFTVTAFLPVLLPFFHVKNDLITQILPTRFVISESLHSGFFPWWNPYINYGIPQYSDMNCGFWNPILWITAIFFRYNIWTITYEELLYIFLSGWGIYLVLKELGLSKNISILGGFSYMSSGYIVGHLQHFCWITGAAFLPFVFYYFIRINKNPGIKNFLPGALSTFFFLSSCHPGLIIGAVYFFSLSFFAIILFKKSLLKAGLHPAYVKNNFIFLSLSLALSACVIIAYAEAIPYITRGKSLSGLDTVSNATTLQSYISLLLPLVVNKSTFFNTDISMRNIYTGLYTLPGLFLFLKNFNRKIGLFVMACMTFYILLSAGGIFKTIANSVIPLASYVRSSGEFSLFTVFIMIIAGGIGLNSLNLENRKIFKWDLILKKTGLLYFILLVAAIIIIYFTKNSLLFFIETYSTADIKKSLKKIIADLSFEDLLIIQSFLNLLTIYFLIRAIAQKNKFGLAMILSINLMAITWLTLPFTGVGAKSKREINSMLSRSTHGINNQPLIAVNDFAVRDSEFLAFSGLPYTYLKKIGTPEWNPYPIQVKNNAAYFNDKQVVSFISQRPYIFLSMDTTINTAVNADTSDINIEASGPGYIKAFIKNDQFNYITLLQNDYLHWRVFINGENVLHFTTYKTFISTPIPKTSFTIEYRFRPNYIIIIAVINLAGFIIAVLFSIFLWVKSFTDKNNFKKTNQFPENRGN